MATAHFRTSVRSARQLPTSDPSDNCNYYVVVTCGSETAKTSAKHGPENTYFEEEFHFVFALDDSTEFATFDLMQLTGEGEHVYVGSVSVRLAELTADDTERTLVVENLRTLENCAVVGRDGSSTTRPCVADRGFVAAGTLRRDR